MKKIKNGLLLSERLRLHLKTRLLNRIRNGIKDGTIKSESISAFIVMTIEKNLVRNPIDYSIQNNRVAIIRLFKEMSDEHLESLKKMERVIMTEIEFIKVLESNENE